MVSVASDMGEPLLTIGISVLSGVGTKVETELKLEGGEVE